MDGVRGTPVLDIDAYCAAAARLSVIAVAFDDLADEIDITRSGCYQRELVLVFFAVDDDPRAQSLAQILHPHADRDSVGLAFPASAIDRGQAHGGSLVCTQSVVAPRHSE